MCPKAIICRDPKFLIILLFSSRVKLKAQPVEAEIGIIVFTVRVQGCQIILYNVLFLLLIHIARITTQVLEPACDDAQEGITILNVFNILKSPHSG